MFHRSVLASLALLAACSSRQPAPDFTLTADTGSSWQLSQQHSTLLLTFGFSHCADTCPALLARLSHIANVVNQTQRHPIGVAMVTVDPQRDHPAQLHSFVSRYDATGLTGTQSQIDAVETAYHVWAQRLPLKRGHYDYAHATAIYVITAAGNIAAVRDDSDTDASIISAVERANSA